MASWVCYFFWFGDLFKQPELHLCFCIYSWEEVRWSVTGESESLNNALWRHLESARNTDMEMLLDLIWGLLSSALWSTGLLLPPGSLCTPKSPLTVWKRRVKTILSAWITGRIEFPPLQMGEKKIVCLWRMNLNCLQLHSGDKRKGCSP